MKWGIDVSEHNQPLSWQSLKKQGASFIIVRLGWGKGHLDSRFYEQVNGVLAAGLELGIYYYSYALIEEEAAEEARFTAAVLKDCGLSKDRLPAGCWLDMEDADGYKERRGIAGREEITALCRSFLLEMEKKDILPASTAAAPGWKKNPPPLPAKGHTSLVRPVGQHLQPAQRPALAVHQHPSPGRTAGGWGYYVVGHWTRLRCEGSWDTPAA